MKADLPTHVSRLIYSALHFSGAARWARRSAAVVFCYHNVVPDELAGRVGQPYLHTGVSDFVEQLHWIKSSHTVVSIDELAERVRDGRSIAGLAVLTFDDGYTGVLNNAVPLLRKLDLPFTLYPVIEAATTRSPFWWDVCGELTPEERSYCLTTLQGDRDRILARFTQRLDVPEDALPADWTMLRNVVADDVTIGVHSVTHRNLGSLSADVISKELNESRARLQQELGRVSTTVAYPYGLLSPTAMNVVEQEGFSVGLSLDSRVVRPGIMPYAFPRVNVPAGIPMSNFACWSSGLTLRRS